LPSLLGKSLLNSEQFAATAIYDKNPRLFLNLMLSRTVADFRRLSGAPGPVFFDRGIPDLIGYAPCLHPVRTLILRITTDQSFHYEETSRRSGQLKKARPFPVYFASS
jgi:predicted ATPase